MRLPALLLACLALVAAALAGCGGGGEEPVDVPTPSEARAALRGAPPPLRALHEQAAELLPGGRDAFEARLRELRGHPVVVNVWAAWCRPCKAEFPLFQRAAVRYGGSVGFLGVDTRDVPEHARDWLRQRWVAYPTYVDHDGDIANGYSLVGVPATIFLDGDGEIAYLKQGEYKDEDDLERDLQRYLGAVPGTS